MTKSVSSQYTTLKLMLSLPRFMRKSLFKEDRSVVRGSPLDQHTQTTLALQKIQGRPPLDEVGKAHGVEAARAGYQQFYTLGAYEGRKCDVSHQDIEVPGAEGALKARLYTPAKKKSDGLLLYIHGGGFTVGDIVAYDLFNRYLAAYLGMMLLFPEYRLAPEHKFPAAALDSIACTKALPDLGAQYGFNAENVVIGGDSAGGLLTVVCGHEAALNGQNIKALWPLFPALDFSEEYPSNHDYGVGFGLSANMMEWFDQCYTEGTSEDRKHPFLSPMYLPTLEKLPETLLRIAEYDPLADQSREFSKKLTSLGVKHEVRLAKGLVHGYTNMLSVIPAAKRTLHEDLDWIKSRV